MLLLYFHLHPCTLYSTRVPFSLVMEGIPNEFIAHQLNVCLPHLCSYADVLHYTYVTKTTNFIFVKSIPLVLKDINFFFQIKSYVPCKKIYKLYYRFEKKIVLK